MIDSKTHISQHILDLFALIECHTAIDAILNTIATQLIFYQARLSISAIEDGHIVVFNQTAMAPDHLLHHMSGLATVVGGKEIAELSAHLVLRIDLLRYAVLVLADKRVGCVDYGLSGTIVLL